MLLVFGVIHDTQCAVALTLSAMFAAVVALHEAWPLLLPARQWGSSSRSLN